jgi:ribosomal protein S18 acetylase RimI-like enzyme
MDYQVVPLSKTEPIPFDLLLTADEEKQAIERYIHQSDLYVVRLKDQIIGVYALYAIDIYVAEIKAIAVKEAFQQQGIGKLMLRDAETRCRAKAFTELIIGTPTTATRQLALYQKAGFELFDIRKNFFIDHYVKPIIENGIQLTDMALLRKKLL